MEREVGKEILADKEIARRRRFNCRGVKIAQGTTLALPAFERLLRSKPFWIIPSKQKL
jgi:hypothetical protein